jgi:hypothetical protein
MGTRGLVLCVLCLLPACRRPVAREPAAPTVMDCRRSGASNSGVRIGVVGTIEDADVARTVAAALCPRLEELGYCISIVHRDQPELRGTLDIELDLATRRTLTPVTVIGGSVQDKRIRACVVDALEVIDRAAYSSLLRLTLQVSARDSRGAPPRASGKDPMGRLAPEVIKQLIRAHFVAFRACYEERLADLPALEGAVAVRFVIDEDGAVESANIHEAGSTIADPTMRACIRDRYLKIRFPRPVGGKVMVTYPVEFTNY